MKKPGWRSVALGLAMTQTQCGSPKIGPCLSIAPLPDAALVDAEIVIRPGLKILTPPPKDAGVDALHTVPLHACLSIMPIDVGPCLSDIQLIDPPMEGGGAALPTALDRAALMAKVLKGLPADVVARLKKG